MGNQHAVNGGAQGGSPEHASYGGSSYHPGGSSSVATATTNSNHLNNNINLAAGAQLDSSAIPNFQRSASDASMTIMDTSGSASVIGASSHHHHGGGGAGAKHPPNISNSQTDDWLDDDTVPTVFRWEHGGRNVYITGTFNGWSRQIPLHRSGNDFTYIHNLKRGKHAFKFIVDDEWRFAPDQPTVADIEGRINNFIDVTAFQAYTGDKEFEKEQHSCVLSDKAADSDDNQVFSHNMPDVYDYTKEPPPLPPHLRHIILNKPPSLSDTAALPVPQHVALNHLYCTAIRDQMMVLGITQRYKTKFVTTVYYSPCNNTNNNATTAAAK